MNKTQNCKDCFAYKGLRCMALTEMVCKTQKCSFYKTHKQFMEDLKKYPPSESFRGKIYSGGEMWNIPNKGRRVKRNSI